MHREARRGGRGGRSGRNDSRSEIRPAKLQRTEGESSVIHLGLWNEHTKQTLSVFWEQLYQNLASDYPLNACSIIDVLPDEIEPPVQPIMMGGLSGAEKKLWEQTVLKGFTSDVETYKSEIRALKKERVSLVAKVKQFVTPLLHDRLCTVFGADNALGLTWISTTSVAELKTMVTSAYNASKSVLSQNRQSMARDRFEWVKMLPNEPYDQFVLKFRRAVIERDQDLSTPLTEHEKCYYFLKKLNDNYEAVKVDVASGESKNEIRLSSGLPPMDGFGYPATLDLLVTSVLASYEASNRHKSTGYNSSSFVTVTDTGRGRGKGRGHTTRGRGGRSGRGPSIPPASAIPTTNVNIKANGKYPDVLVNLKTGLKKSWTEMSIDDNPVEYGRPSCRTCLLKGNVGLHFSKFHE